MDDTVPTTPRLSPENSGAANQTPPAPPETPQTSDETPVETATTPSQIRAELDAFKLTLPSEFDFQETGGGGTSLSTTLGPALDTFYSENETKEPAHLRPQWWEAVKAAVRNHLETYDKPFDDITADEALRVIQEVRAEVGSFEKWAQKSPQNTVYNQWKSEQESRQQAEAAEASRRTAEEQQQASELQARLEPLRTYEGDPDITPEKYTEFMEKVRSGEKSADEVKDIFEKAKAAAIAAREAAEDAEMPGFSRAKQLVESMDEGGLKSSLGGIIKALFGLVGSLASFGFARRWISKNLISSKDLAAAGNKEAALAYRTEQVFRKFGLPRDLAIDYAEYKTSDIVKQMKDPVEVAKITTAAEGQQRIAMFVAALEKAGGDVSEEALGTFLERVNVAPQKAPTAQPAAPTQAAESPLVAGAAPAAAPGTPQTGPQAAPESPAAAPAQGTPT